MSLGNIILGAWVLGDPEHLPISLPTNLEGAAGIASAEAFGSGGEVAHPPQTITGTVGVASEGAVGSGVVQYPPQTITGAAGITSRGALGAPGGAHDGEVYGPLYVAGTAGLASVGTLGAGVVTGPLVGAAGIASSGVVGSDGVISSGTLTGTVGIASELAFGVAGTLGSIGGPVDGSVVPGIASAEAFGIGVVAGPITGATGIASADAFGATGDIGIKLTGVTGIPSEGSFPDAGHGWLNAGLRGALGITSAQAFGATGVVVSFSNLNSNFQVYIGGQDRSAYVHDSSIKVDLQLNFVGSANLSLVDEAVSWLPSAGAEVIIYFYYDGDTSWHRIFAGSIESVELKSNPGGVERFYEVQVADYSKSLAKRILNKRYDAEAYNTVNKIMADLSATILLAEGITWVDLGDTDVDVGEIEFSYTPVNEVLDKLAELTGREWRVDFYKNLYLAERPNEITSSPIDLRGDYDETWRDLVVRVDRGMYRNVQYVKANFTQSTSIITKRYTYASLFSVPPVVPYQIGWTGIQLVDKEYYGKIRKIHKIEVNGVEQIWYLQAHIPGDPYWNDTMEPGTNTPPSGWQYVQPWAYDLDLVWNIADPVIGAAIPTSGYIDVTFEIVNEMPQPVVVRDETEIAARRAIEGGTGIYEAVDEIGDVTDRDLVVAYAQALLDRFKVMGIEVSATVFPFGLWPGQEITVDRPDLGIVEQVMNIDSVSLVEEQRTQLRTDVKVTNKLQQSDALNAFHRIMKLLKKPNNQNKSTITFHAAQTLPGITNPGLETGSDMAPVFIARRDITVIDVVIYAKTAPTGAAAKFDIRDDGVSIFPGGYSFSYPDGGTVTSRHSQFNGNPLVIKKDSRVTLDVLQTGSINPGKDYTIVLSGWV